jgi:hypothetical protein
VTALGLGIFLGGLVLEATPKPPVTSATAEIPDAGTSVCNGARAHGKVVVITIDGVRWQEIFGGTEAGRPGEQLTASDLTPNLHALGERGAFVGAPGYGSISATGPSFISFPGYTEMFSGHPAPCQSNKCPRNIRTTVFDEAWVAGETVAAFTSWRRIDLAATTMEKGFYRSCGDHRESRPDVETAAAAMAYYEREQPDVFFFGLAEPDTAAHHNDYPEYVAKLRQADRLIGQLIAMTDPDTHIFVTADHGRSWNFRDHITPDAAQVWMIAAGPRIPARGAVFSPKPRHLSNLAPTVRDVLGLSPDRTDGASAVLDELFQSTASNELPIR